MEKLKFHIPLCLFVAVLAISASFTVFAAEDSEGALDGDFEDAEVDAEATDAEVECLRDDDCEAGWICRDVGVCVPLNCDEDADCQVEGFYCREDGVCAPVICVYDRDCPQEQFCDNGVCLTTPGEKGYPYVEGGSPNCNSAGNFSAAVAFILLLMSLALARLRSSAK